MGLAHVSALELVPSKTTYKLGENVVISFSDEPGNNLDGAGIYKERQTPGDDFSIQFEYLGGKISGELVFDPFDPLSVGKYEAHLFENDGYEILASTSFVGDKASIEDITNQFVKLSTPETTEPNSENVSKYREVQSLQNELSKSIYKSFSMHRNLIA